MARDTNDEAAPIEPVAYAAELVARAVACAAALASMAMVAWVVGGTMP